MTLQSSAPQPIGSPPKAYAAARRALASLQPKTVLDCPAGEGAFTRELVDAGYDVAASDILPDNFRISDVDCSYCDLNDRIELESDAYDAVTCLNGLHRVWARGRALRELARVLKPGGHLILTFVNNANLAHRMTFLTSGSVIHNTLGPPHVNHPNAEQPAACFRYPMTIGDVLAGMKSVGLRAKSVEGVGLSKGSLAFLPAALVPLVGRWFLPGKYRKFCSLDEADSMKVLFSDYLMVVAEKPRA